jgi:hypothetical protein
LLGGRAPRSTRTCGCATTLREILVTLGTGRPSELLERDAVG